MSKKESTAVRSRIGDLPERDKLLARHETLLGRVDGHHPHVRLPTLRLVGGALGLADAHVGAHTETDEEVAKQRRVVLEVALARARGFREKQKMNEEKSLSGSSRGVGAERVE